MAVLMSYQDKYLLSFIQSELREVELYHSKIDGLIGKGCYDAFDTITKVLGNNKPIKRLNVFTPKDIFKTIQQYLVDNGYNTKGVDGIWGKGSQTAFDTLIEAYRHKASTPHHWYAWTGNNAVFDDGVVKLRKWLIEDNQKPDIHVDYVLSLFALITKQRFDPSMRNTEGAVGLIGFTQVAASNLGTTVDALGKMTFSEQIDYVIKYYKTAIGKITSLNGYYGALMYPSDPERPIPESVSNALLDSLWNGLDPINRDIVECHVNDIPPAETPKVENPNIAKPVDPSTGKSGFVFGKASEQRLVGVKPILVKVVRRALELSTVDFGVREGLRSIETQREYVRKGVSQTMNSKHLTGDAVDLYPSVLPPDWGTNINVFMPVLIAVHKASLELGVKMRFGVNWKGDPTLSIETKFVDAPHCELN